MSGGGKSGPPDLRKKDDRNAASGAMQTFQSLLKSTSQSTPRVGSEHSQQAGFMSIAIAPLLLRANIAYRASVLKSAQTDRVVQAALRERCAEDPVFFINTFCWLLETRDEADWQVVGKFGQNKVIPFITREYQAEAIRESAENLGKRDIIVVKSRETGVTWIYIALAVWDWLFHEQTHIGLVSKDEPSVDSANDPDSLFNKIQFLVDRMPSRLLSEDDFDRNLSDHTFLNERNGSTISGYAATGNVARGGRKRWFLMDEFHFFRPGADYEAHDSTSHVTRCRVMVSTPNRKRGRGGAFYDAVQEAATSNAILIDIDWKDDPEKSRGLYKSVNRRLEIVDQEFWEEFRIDGDRYRHPYQDGEYNFVLDDKVRSLYYDFECHRPLATPQSIAAELDKNFGGATAQFIDASLLARCEKLAEPVLFHGEFFKAGDGWVLDREVLGEARSWVPLYNGRPSEGEYSIGADVSAGTGGNYTNYSGISIFNKRNGVQCFEWRSNLISPTEFASLLCWVGRFFWNAYLVVEANGPIGQLCIKEILKRGYPNLYYRNRDKRAYQQKTEEPGYWNSDGGEVILGMLEAALRGGAAKVHSTLTLRELGQYFFKNGKLVNASSANSEDEANKGKAHGDMAIATAVAWHGVEDWPASEKAPATPTNPPVGSFLYRQQQALMKAQQANEQPYWKPQYGRTGSG